MVHRPLRDYLLENNLSQEELGDKVGLSKASISRIIDGSQLLPEKLIPKFAEVTGIPRKLLRPDLWELMTE